MFEHYTYLLQWGQNYCNSFVIRHALRMRQTPIRTSTRRPTILPAALVAFFNPCKQMLGYHLIIGPQTSCHTLSNSSFTNAPSFNAVTQSIQNFDLCGSHDRLEIISVTRLTSSRYLCLPKAVAFLRFSGFVTYNFFVSLTWRCQPWYNTT